ncbi:MAG: indole-3-glycerol phosphate synthase TrpC [Candidatus Saganbacteria bacterium]|nr:indole-3-glycerol phosphate synthase TrpC [Candidatus Saganbacteria bacterium]
MSILDEIIAKKQKEIKLLKKQNVRQFLGSVLPANDFLGALPKGSGAIIAEVKKASPSKGVIVDKFIPAEIAQTYQEGGAAAISVLTDQHFQGKLSYLEKVKIAVDLPVLRKDFIIDEEQIYESRVAGADAILLIAKLLPLEKLSEFLKLTHDLGMEALVEVHSEIEMEKVLETDAQLIGINSRNLDTFQTDLTVTIDIMDSFPELIEKIVVAESGIDSYEQIEMLRDKGIDAFLVGESILKSTDPAAKIRELMGI